MDIRRYARDNIILLDGGMGTLLQEKGLLPGEYPERWNVTHSDIIVDIHKAYFDAGSNVVNTNTFGANLLRFSTEELEQVVESAVANARQAKELSEGTQEKFIALDIGPLGKMLKPYGDMDFNEAVEVFATTVKLGVKYGVDLVVVETMNDGYETKAAVLAVKESCDLPIFVTNAYGEDGVLTTGADPLSMVAMLEGLGVDAIGANCSLGPNQLLPVVERLVEYSSIPVIMKPNAGLPKAVGDKTVFDVDVASFAEAVLTAVKHGVNIVGGCCGTTPEYIKAVAEKIRGMEPTEIAPKDITVVSSFTHGVIFDEPILVGERINPTGKKPFRQALINNDIDYILSEGIAQQDRAKILDVNVGIPDVDEVKMLTKVVTELQAVVDSPLQIDTSNPVALEKALRVYNGKAMINSVNGKEDSMNAVFPLAKKYGGVVVALTLDEEGIPATSEGRVAIAKKILTRATEYGIGRKDIVFDPLCLTVSADSKNALVTLDAVKRITEELNCKTILGISNISFGLPNRDIINSAFLISALNHGLSSAIVNPLSDAMMNAYRSYKVLAGLDRGCLEYIEEATAVTSPVNANVSEDTDCRHALSQAIKKGLKEKSGVLTDRLLAEATPMDIVQEVIIPALDEVGIGYEEKRIYLPQLLMSAESAKSAFERIKVSFSAGGKASSKCNVVLATVRGDIHDIGKNIVKLLLENYGYDVIDLGKDVPPDEVLTAVKAYSAPIVGLSALMTTTVPAMEETIKLIKKEVPSCQIIVGGAVLNEEYAKKIGADHYAKDGMATVRHAERIWAEIV